MIGFSTRATVRNTTRALACAAALLATGLPAVGQGTVGNQGFGYPPGQLSTRAMGTGGALGEVDPLSPINPAALAGWSRASIFFQYQPEFRRIRAPGGNDRTTTVRFPVTGVTVPFRQLTFGVTVSTLLDRTWSTQVDTSVLLAGDTLRYTETFRSTGANNDIRFGLGWQIGRSLRLGAGAHVLTGENRLMHAQLFHDTVTGRSADVNESATVSYTGSAFSGGVVLRAPAGFIVAASGRAGGTMRARDESDSLLSTAHVPSRFGGSLVYEGIPGSAIAVRGDWEGWSNLRELGSSRLSAFDASGVSAGAEIAGPRFSEQVIPLRLGGQWRALPFGVRGKQVHERALDVGAGLPISSGRVLLDLAAQHAARTASGAPRETSWTFSVGITVRP